MEVCRSCGSKRLVVSLFLPKVLPSVQYLPPNKNTKINHTSITLYQCRDCKLIQTPWQMPQNYYDDYIMTVGFSKQLKDYLFDLSKSVLDIVGTNNVNVLDVGCGDGTFMEPFKELGCSVVGIEPSSLAVEEARKKGLTVHQGYLEKDTKIADGPFDVFVSRQVFEHISDFNELILGIKSNITRNAIGVIEVPSFEKALKDSRFYDIFPDHVNYFTINSLANLLTNYGFQIIKLCQTMHDEYNVAIVRNTMIDDLSMLSYSNQLLIDNIQTFLNNKKQDNKKIAVWGAGAKGVSILSQIELADSLVHSVIDSDENKQGRFTPISGIEIKDPVSCLSSIDEVLILAVAYQHSIIDKLRNDFGFKGNIWLLDGVRLKTVA